jgi:hypothetical protein
MLKPTLAAVILASALAVPAFAMETKCDEPTMTKMDTDLTAMKDVAMKDKAMKEMTLAKAAMKKDKMDDCATHLENAMKNMM